MLNNPPLRDVANGWCVEHTTPQPFKRWVAHEVQQGAQIKSPESDRPADRFTSHLSQASQARPALIHTAGPAKAGQPTNPAPIKTMEQLLLYEPSPAPTQRASGNLLSGMQPALQWIHPCRRYYRQLQLRHHSTTIGKHMLDRRTSATSRSGEQFAPPRSIAQKGGSWVKSMVRVQAARFDVGAGGQHVDAI